MDEISSNTGDRKDDLCSLLDGQVKQPTHCNFYHAQVYGSSICFDSGSLYAEHLYISDLNSPHGFTVNFKVFEAFLEFHIFSLPAAFDFLRHFSHTNGVKLMTRGWKGIEHPNPLFSYCQCLLLLLHASQR